MSCTTQITCIAIWVTFRLGDTAKFGLPVIHYREEHLLLRMNTYEEQKRLPTLLCRLYSVWRYLHSDESQFETDIALCTENMCLYVCSIPAANWCSSARSSRLCNYVDHWGNVQCFLHWRKAYNSASFASGSLSIFSNYKQTAIWQWFVWSIRQTAIHHLHCLLPRPLLLVQTIH